MIYIILSLLTTSVLPAEPHVSITIAKSSGYSVGYGNNRAEAYSIAVKNLPVGATAYPAQFIQYGVRSYKCIIRWEK